LGLQTLNTLSSTICLLFAHDLHYENVVRLPEIEEMAVIDPYISLARSGTWAALKLAEVGFATPPDDSRTAG